MLEIFKEIETTSYKKTILYQTSEFEICSIEWTLASISEAHSHGMSQSMTLVQEGLFENILDLGFKTERKVYEVGQVITTPPGAKHKMHCLSPRGKTLHVYTPKVMDSPSPQKFNSQITEDLKKTIQISDPISIDSLREVLTDIRNQSVSTQSPFFMNQLFSGILPQMLMAEEFALQLKTTMATSEASPVLTKLEEEVVDSLGKQIGWPIDQRCGITVPGGSAANFMALHCARQFILPNIKNAGNSGIQLRAYVSSEAHYSMKKACAVLGLGIENLVSILVDSSSKMKMDLLQQAIETDIQNGFKPLFVCATAGTTVLGSFDPIAEIAEICQKQNLWLHVDAAWGGPALFSENLKPLVKGIAQADSVTFDAHKLFGANLTSSFFLTRHERILFEANDVSGAEYIFHQDTYDRGQFSWQCGRRAEAVSFWVVWKSVGTAGLAEFVDKLLNIRDQILSFIKTKPRFELVATPEFLNICVRVLAPTGQDPHWSEKVRAALIENNQAMVNFSTDAKGSFLRLILAHPYLEFEHVEKILNLALEVE